MVVGLGGGTIRMSDNAAEFHAPEDDVFARIAGDYDRYCDYFSLYIQRHWKRSFVAQVARETGDTLLDLASGTGDIPQRVLKKRKVRIAVTDICEPMLNVARRKLDGQDGISFGYLDACDMAGIADSSFDIITMAFGMKIIDRQKALAEIHRCLKPGGVFLNIDASVIPLPWLQRLYLSYMDTCLPLMGRLIARGDAGAYQYLLKGIHDFPGGPDFADELRGYGFGDVTVRPLTLGIVAIHRAVKPLV
jgi:demethylmenaquinone methyltransferase / 2-methoxy-6-polyprenyl-1,4-benzoquinol methylase